MRRLHLTAVPASFSVTPAAVLMRRVEEASAMAARDRRADLAAVVDRHALPRLSLAEMIVGVVPQPAIRVDHHKRTHTMVGHPRARMHRALLVVVYTLAMSGAILE